MKALYIVDQALKLSTIHFNTLDEALDAALAFEDLGLDVFTDRAQALTAIDICQTQYRKNKSKENA